MEILIFSTIFFACKYSTSMKKGPDELRADEEEGESERKVTNQIFGRLHHPKKELSYVIKNFVSLSLIFSKPKYSR